MYDGAPNTHPLARVVDTILETIDDESGIRELLLEAIHELLPSKVSGRVEELPIEVSAESEEQLAKEATELIRDNLGGAVQMMVELLVEVSFCLALTSAKQKVESPPDEVREGQPSAAGLKRICEPVFDQWLKSLTIQPRKRGGRHKRANLSDLRVHYDEIIEDWRRALEACRTALASPAKRKNWRDNIRQTFAFPDDLIERLQPMTDWPIEIADICQELGGEDKPEDIALEHAARLCGAQKYAYKLTSLREKYKRQKREI